MAFTARVRHAAASLFFVALAVPITGQAQTLPAARQLIARHVATIGGREALSAKRSVRARGVFEMPAMGVRGDFDMAQSVGGAMVVKITVPGLGEIQSGFDGSVAWAMNPMVGPRVLDGKELAQTRDEANFLAVLREAPAVAAVETVEVTTMGGERCYKVRVTWASGRRSFDCYSVESGMLVGTIVTVESPGGALDATTTLKEYRDFGGVRMATVMTQSAAGQEQILRVSSVEFDNVSSSMFVLPPAIATLVQRAASPR